MADAGTGSGSEAKSGLEGVVVADTRLSDVDGERGRLTIAGHDVEDLVQRATFEDLCALLWQGALPDARGRATFQTMLAAARARAFARLPALGDALESPDGMEALRAAVSHLRVGSEPELEQACAVTGALAVFAAASVRVRAGETPIAPDGALGHAADYLRMMTGQAPNEAETRGMDAYLVTVSDHGMNASTFCARIVASTGSDIVSAVVAAIGALKGPLHGGAPGPVLDMLDAIGAPERAVPWLEAELAAGRRIMGMGHRVYRVRDPRAAVFERAVAALEQAGVSTGRLPLARAVERAAEDLLRKRHPQRSLRANVEWYTAVLLEALGVPRAAFSPTFAVSRVAGWVAHVAEQRQTGRLIRPASRYVGPPPAVA